MKLLCFDPGEATGWATFEVAPDGSSAEYKLLDSGTVYDQTVVADAVDCVCGVSAIGGVVPAEAVELAEVWRQPGHIAFEDWVIYPHKAQDLIGDYCRTARLIGVIQHATRIGGIPSSGHLAREHKTVAETAGAEELFETPLHENRHANDAKRLGVAWIVLRSFHYRKAQASPTA